MNHRPIAAKILLVSVLALTLLSFVNIPAPYRVFTRFCPFHWGVTFQNFTPGIVLFLTFNYFLIALFGFALTASYYRDIRGLPFYAKWIASFFIGTLCALGLLRPLSLLVPYEHLYWPGAALILILTIVFLQKSYPEFLKGAIRPRLPNIKSICWFAGFVAAAIFFLWAALTLQIQQADFKWVGHGYQQYAVILEQWQASPPAHFPILPRHYDELLLHAFLTVPLKASFNPILPWWITLAVTKFSLAVFFFAFFRKLNANFHAALLFSAFLLLGTSSLIPTRYFMLFDALNPLFYTVHSGRIAGIGICLFMIGCGLDAQNKTRPLPVTFFILSAIGLSATTISNTLWLLAFYATTVLFYLTRSALQEEKTKILWGLPALTVISAIAFYALPFDRIYAHIIRLALLSCILGLLLERIWPRLAALPGILRKLFDQERKPLSAPFIVWLAASGIGLIFLGNIGVLNPLGQTLRKLLETLSGPVPIETLNAGIYNQGTFSIGDFRTIASYTAYSHGPAQFVAYYGLFLAMILAANFFFSRIADTPPSETRIRDQGIYESFLLAVCGFTGVLFFMDFLGLGDDSWVKTRFLEIPYYFSVFCFFYSLLRFGKKNEKRFLTILLWIFIIVPIIGTERIPQLADNWKVFWALLQS